MEERGGERRRRRGEGRGKERGEKGRGRGEDGGGKKGREGRRVYIVKWKSGQHMYTQSSRVQSSRRQSECPLDLSVKEMTHEASPVWLSIWLIQAR